MCNRLVIIVFLLLLSGGVSGQESEIKALDIGLSVKWADRNIGAHAPSDAGRYFAWGELRRKKVYSETTYLYMDEGAYIDIGQDISGTEYDVAFMRLGDGWRMPTIYEVAELFSMCYKVIEECDGMLGIKAVGPNGRSIFLPAAGGKVENEKDGVGVIGMYWTSTRAYGFLYSASCMCFDQTGCDLMEVYRYMGCTIRPVHD